MNRRHKILQFARLTPCLLLGLTACGSIFAETLENSKPAPAELRGTWMTATANTALASPGQVNASIKALRDICLNTVYVETWKNGDTKLPSPVL